MTIKNVNLTHVVKHVLKKRRKILQVVKKYKTPFYLHDSEELRVGINDFQKTFKKYIPQLRTFYAMKSNPHEFLLKEVVRSGLGIDVSSGRELRLALKASAKELLFTGPAKTVEELTLALGYSDKLTLNIDSFTELKKVQELNKKCKKKIKVGIRIFTSHHGNWNKFGIPLNELSSMWKLLGKDSYFEPLGIQVHMSFNESAKPYENIIKEIGIYLNKNNPLKKKIRFIDLGGGFLPFNSQGLIIKKTKQHIDMPAVPLYEYASGIAKAIKKYLSDVDCEYYFEPGRIISNNAMHIILKVEDVKRSNIVITDGGTNIVGWERFEEDYFPVINLTHPSLREMKCTIFGSLCTPDDIWGYYCYAKKIEEGDILLIPYQGAYTYTYAQEFIKPFPKVYRLS